MLDVETHQGSEIPLRCDVLKKIRGRRIKSVCCPMISVMILQLKKIAIALHFPHYESMNLKSKQHGHLLLDLAFFLGTFALERHFPICFVLLLDIKYRKGLQDSSF